MNALAGRIPRWRQAVETGVGAAFAALVRSQKPAGSIAALHGNGRTGNRLEWAPDRKASLIA